MTGPEPAGQQFAQRGFSAPGAAQDGGQGTRRNRQRHVAQRRGVLAVERERLDPDPQRRPGRSPSRRRSGRPGDHNPRRDGGRREHQRGSPEAPLGGRVGDVAVAGAGSRDCRSLGRRAPGRGCRRRRSGPGPAAPSAGGVRRGGTAGRARTTIPRVSWACRIRSRRPATAGRRVRVEARTKPNCGGILRAARAERRSGTLTVKEKSRNTSTQAVVRVPSSSANSRPSAVTRAGPHWARTVWPSGKKRPCSTSRDRQRGARITAAADRTRPATPPRTARTAAASATATDSGQLAAAVVTTAAQPAAVSAVKGCRRVATRSHSHSRGHSQSVTAMSWSRGQASWASGVRR